MVADWTDGDLRARAYARMRTMDHLGATLGGIAAAAAAWLISPQQLWLAVASLAIMTLWVAWLARGLRDAPAPITKSAPVGWWPRSPTVRRPLAAITIATLATKISPLLVLIQVTGLPAEGTSDSWPLWLVCLGWAALGLIQAGASILAGSLTARIGPEATLRFGWLAGAGVFVGLALADGPWLIAAGVAFGVVSGLTEGAEKAWLANLAPRDERALTFGAMALVTAISGLAGNAACGWLLVAWGRKCSGSWPCWLPVVRW